MFLTEKKAKFDVVILLSKANSLQINWVIYSISLSVYRCLTLMFNFGIKSSFINQSAVKYFFLSMPLQQCTERTIVFQRDKERLN